MASTDDRDRARAWEPRTAPFVGREHELGLLTAALGEASRGRGSAFALVGEAGIGKTRLASEIVDLALDRGLRVGVARCTQLEGAPAFWPWIEILRGLALREGDGRSLSPQPGLEELYALLSYLGVDVPPVPAMGDEARFALLDAVVKGITRTASDKPLVLLIDDLHWADADSIVLLRELARRSEHHPLVLLATYRDKKLDGRHAEALAGYERDAGSLLLEGLGADEALRLVAWKTGREPTRPRLEQLLVRSGGNPLFLGELSTAPDHAPLPETVRLALAPRIEAPSPNARELLAYAAVLGQEFELELWARLADRPRPEMLEALEELLRLSLLTRVGPADDFAFAHALIHETAYDAVPLAERATLHERIAAILEEAAPAATEAEKARLAHHLAQAGARASRAVEVAAAGAAELAREGLAPHRAADHLELALRAQRSLSPKPEDYRARRLALLLSLGEMQAALGVRVDARKTYDEAMELARALGNASALGTAAAGWVGFQEAPIEFSAEAMARIEEALAALEGCDVPARAGLLSLFVYCLWHWKRFDRCEAMARDAVDCAERIDDAPMRAQALMALHRALNAPEQAAERLAISRRAVALASEHAPRHVEAIARRRLAIDLLQRGDVAEGRREMMHLVRIWEELRKPVDRWSIAAMRGALALQSGDLDDAERHVSDVIRLGQDVESRVAPVVFAAQLFRLRAHQGRLDEIVDLLRARVHNAVVPAMALLVPLALIQLDRREEARASFERVAANDFDDQPRDENWTAVLCAAAQIVHYLGDTQRAVSIRAQLLPYAGQNVLVGYGHYWVGSVARFLALLEATLGRAEAGQHFVEAIASHRRAGARPLLAETLVECGHWLAGRGDLESAAARWREARDLYRALELDAFVERLDALLASLGASLTAREDEPSHAGVARLIREGERWRVEFGGKTVFIDDRKGLRDIAALVAVPGRELHVLDLMERAPAEAHATEPGLRSGAGPMGGGGLDARARAAYRARRAELRSELEAAEQRNDATSMEAFREEMQWLEAELRSVLRGGEGPLFVQRARKAVYNRIRATLKTLERSHPELGRHLRHGIQTGEVCRYMSERPLRWEVRPE